MYVGTWAQVPTYIHHTDLRRESEGRESWHELTVPGGHQPDISCKHGHDLFLHPLDVGLVSLERAGRAVLVEG